MFKIFCDCHTKKSLKQRAILKIPSILFLEEPMCFLLTSESSKAKWFPVLR